MSNAVCPIAENEILLGFLMLLDIVETPAAAVIDLLREQGAEVTWHDDVVGTWRGETSVPINGASIAVLVTRHDGLDISAVRRCGYVFDCTGTIAGAEGV